MPRILKDIKINEVSSVDRGAGRGVKVLLMKREFSGKERDRLAGTGAAMEDGSFPIVTVGDLENAIRAIGRAKDPAKAKAHIISRARSLGATDKLPDDWVKKDFNGDVEMTKEELDAVIAKSVGDAVKTAVTEVSKSYDEKLAKADFEIVLLKMSPAQKAYMDGCDEPTKKKFAAMSDNDRDDYMSKNPIRKAADPVTAADLAKRDDVVAKALAENADLKKRLDAYDLEKAQATFKKRAAGLGLVEDGDGELMRKAFGGDAEAQAKFEDRIAAIHKAAEAQVETGSLFASFGKNEAEGRGVKAIDELNAKADELRKSEIAAGRQISTQQAFAKVYTDPANAELAARYKREEPPRLAAVV